MNNFKKIKSFIDWIFFHKRVKKFVSSIACWENLLFGKLVRFVKLFRVLSLNSFRKKINGFCEPIQSMANLKFFQIWTAGIARIEKLNIFANEFSLRTTWNVLKFHTIFANRLNLKTTSKKVETYIAWKSVLKKTLSFCKPIQSVINLKYVSYLE